MPKPALGRGLGALLSGTTPAPQAQVQPLAGSGLEPAPGERVQHVPLDRIRPSPLQPRKDFAEDALRELAESIRERGVLQPLIVRTRGDHFELIAGERRWRAAQLLGLTEVPVIVREADDRTVLELSLIENLQRENLNPIEEAQGYAQLIGLFNLTQEEVAARVGKSRAVVANALRLLKLPDEVQTWLRDGRLSVGHAKVILGLTDEKLQVEVARRVVKEGLSVRQTERIVARLQLRHGARTGRKPGPTGAPTDAHLLELETQLRERFGTKVSVRYNEGKGAIEIHFYSDADLERILQILGVSVD
ncbi:MAG: ParB/RepB/Spo0J family partition protein [Verrucomicrobiae bacterium]|nr:ParB/RepB/Spo0J family partition protein [Verrucomicrobiae bacterium]MCX7722896.1 ParB/RepB/Spo0J family partition protein [Verrucomicrobiae bacterium]MDW7979676.1 ParB/RepB/Spo0J family partition protein [Verrucomicrobiales bacterium]